MLLRPMVLRCEAKCSQLYGLYLIDQNLDSVTLRQKACEEGWKTLRYPGAPWRAWDLCPLHRDTPITDLTGVRP